MYRDRLLTIILSVATTWGLMQVRPERVAELEVDRLIVRQELIVSDTGEPWEKGYEQHQIPRGVYAKSLANGTAGLWVRSRLIKGEIDDPFDDRFHALERSGKRRGTPGHISWNMWVDDAWRQLAIIQGEELEETEAPQAQLNGNNHPGRLRFQSFRPDHPEPLTDAIIGQGRMSVGGGGFGGGGLPYPENGIDVWGGALVEHAVKDAPKLNLIDSRQGEPHKYQILAVDTRGITSSASPILESVGVAKLSWESVPGADGYIIVRDGRKYTDILRIEGATKIWQDPE